MNLTKMIKTLVIFILFVSNVFAQQNSTNSVPDVVHPIHPSIVIVIAILCTMFCLTFLILACMKFFQPDLHHQATQGMLGSGSRSRLSGIDKKAIESLPFFKFSSLKGSKQGLECVVCLSKFEDSEVLRLLPKCRHAFHMNCIDKWLESHSSCPLCRNKFDVLDVTNFTCSNSLWYPHDHHHEGFSNHEIFVTREHGDGSSRSSRFSTGSSFRKFGKSPNKDDVTDVLIQFGDQRLLDKFKHKIVVSDIVCKSRWSDVNSSDLMLLNSKMLNEVSSKRFSPSSSGRYEIDMEHVAKFKKDMVGKITDGGETSVSTSYFPRFTNDEESESIEKRSLSEITNVSRYKETRTMYWASSGKDARLQRVWLPMMKRTIQWFTNRERISFESRT